MEAAPGPGRCPLGAGGREEPCLLGSMSPGSSACSWVDATPAIASDSGLALIHICPFVQVSGQQACISALLLKLSSWALGSESRSVVSDCFQLHGLYPVLGILQCRMLAWVAFLFSRASSRPRAPTQGSDPGLPGLHWARRFLARWAVPLGGRRDGVAGSAAPAWCLAVRAVVLALVVRRGPGVVGHHAELDWWGSGGSALCHRGRSLTPPGMSCEGTGPQEPWSSCRDWTGSEPGAL